MVCEKKGGPAAGATREDRLSRSVVGVAERAGTRYAAIEDRHFVATAAGGDAPCGPVVQRRETLIVAVIDGHRGPAMAQFASERLPDLVRTALDRRASLATPIEEVDAAFQADNSGACVALCCLEPYDEGSLKLTACWIGDCRVLVSRRSGGILQITRDHIPVDEEARIDAAGGFVMTRGGQSRVGILPTNAEERRHLKMLATCRAIGDHDFGRVIPADADVQSLVLRVEDHFVLIASDGVFESLDNNYACLIAREILESAPNDPEAPEQAARAVVEAAFQAGSTDDITCVVCRVDREEC